jgi:hypothetical protein
MLWGVEDDVRGRFGTAGIAADGVTCERDTFTFRYPGAPSGFLDDFLGYYGPTMNAYAAAQADGKGEQLRAELEELFTSANTSTAGDTVIPATFLRVTVSV